MTDPAIVSVPFGAEVDGRRLLGEAVGFARALRAARLSIDLGAAVDYARALTLVDLGQRETVRAAGSAIFVRRRDDREIYDRVFDRWWRRATRRRRATAIRSIRFSGGGWGERYPYGDDSALITRSVMSTLFPTYTPSCRIRS